jgi:hypothetical protein
VAQWEYRLVSWIRNAYRMGTAQQVIVESISPDGDDVRYPQASIGVVIANLEAGEWELFDQTEYGWLEPDREAAVRTTFFFKRPLAATP